MNPALVKLLLMQGNAVLRRVFRGTESTRKKAFLAVGFIVIVLWLLSAGLSAIKSKRSDPARVRTVVPLALLGVCLLTAVTSAGDKAIAFTPGEVDQLFPGPFSRRELLGYKLAKSAFFAVLSGLIMSVMLLPHAHSWAVCFIGVFLALLFVMFFSIAVVLVGQTIGEAAFSRVRRVVVAGVFILAFVGVKFYVGGSSGWQVAREFQNSSVGAVVLAPLQAFGNAMTAETFPELLKWAFYAIFLIAILVGLVVMLDANYLEVAMNASQRRYEKIQRMRGGSILSGVGVSNAGRWRLSMLPWAGGAGPIAWRQITHALRTSRGLLLVLAIIAMVAAPLMTTSRHDINFYRGVGIVAMWTVLWLSSMLNYDFRGDIDQMDTLKALPISPIAVCIGQLVAPVMVLSILQWLLLAGIAALLPAQRPVIAAVATVALPFNVLLFCAENLVFMLFPSRPAVASPGDPQILGRKFVFLLMKSLILMAGVLVAAVAGALVWVITGKSLPLTATGTAITFLVEGAGLVALIAWAYQRFDPSVDTPA